jgi:TetR/AcrR family transcriptional regulator, transcriptional repressor for nem operon
LLDKTVRFIFILIMTKAERTRQFIIEQAAPIFNKKGIAGTAISDIMEATKLAKGGVYGNFENKDEICLEVYKYLTQTLSAAINRSMEGKVTAKDKLFALFNFYAERLITNDRGGCPILNFGTEADDTNPIIKQKVKESISYSQNRIYKVTQQGIDDGEFKETFDARQFALKTFTMIEGAILVSRVQGSNEHIKLITDMIKFEIEQNIK